MKKEPAKDTHPITKKEDVQKSNDEHIDQDFEGFPHNPAKEDIINPKTKEDAKTAGLRKGEIKKVEKKDDDEIYSVGSGGAFDATEDVSEDED